MNLRAFLSVFSIMLLSISCTDRYGPFLPQPVDQSGTLRLAVTMGRSGKIAKKMQPAAIEMTSLIVVLTAEERKSFTDTISLDGGSRERTERITYDNLASVIGEKKIEWHLSVKTEDVSGRVIHVGDTTFTLVPCDTTEISLSLHAQYSMFVANFHPIRDSVTRCEVNIDTGEAEADTSFPGQSLLGDTVTLSYDYLTASPSGIEHHIELNVYGGSSAGDTLLYTGDTAILVKSGEDGSYRVYLRYVGPDTLSGAATMAVTLGRIGTVTVDGVLLSDRKDAVPTEGLAAYFPFNGNVEDESGNGNDGEVNGGSSLTGDRFGSDSRACYFDGADDFIKIGDPVPSLLCIRNELTLAAWIYVTEYPPENTLGLIVGSQNDGTASGASIFLDGRPDSDGQPSPAGHIHFQIGNGGWHVSNTNAQVPMNEWVLITASRKANDSAEIYFNGILQPSTSLEWDGSITYTNSELAIGRQKDYPGRYFKGKIDDVRIYSRVLSEDEILQLFHEGGWAGR